MAKKRVFTSFDYDNDSDLKTMLLGQAANPDSPFEMSDWSIKEHLDGDWKKKARARIRAVDQMIVMCGERTKSAAGVSAELEIAQEENIPYFLLYGRSSKICVKPLAAKASDKMYEWTWPILKSLVGGSR